MSSKDAMYSVILKKEGDKLSYRNAADEISYRMFVKALEEGHIVEVFFDASVDSGTLAQIAKIKVCIREMAKFVGTTFEDMEFLIKKASGLCVVKNVEGDAFIKCKSCADASKEELGLMIQTILDKGDFLGMNLR